MKNKIIILLLLITSFIYSTEKDWKVEESKARTLLNSGRTEDAIVILREIILSSDNEAVKRESYYWISLAYTNTGKYNLAENNLEYYLRTYGRRGRFYAEAIYQRGVNFFLMEQYSHSIELLAGFIKDNPSHRFTSNAYYWLGECLYSLGRFDDAVVYFTIVTEKYPGTSKYEASIFKLRLIEHKKTELVLQNIIKWSHEQYLSAINQFKINEMALLQAMEELRKGRSADPQETARLNSEIERLRQRNSELERGLQGQSTGMSVTERELAERAKQLEFKAMLLDRKEHALKLLEEQLRLRESANE